MFRVAAVAAVVCATIAIAIVFFEEQMIYYPTRHPDGFWDTEAVARGTGTTVEDCFFSTADDLQLHGWWCRPMHAEGRTAELVMLWFHGNAGNLSHRYDLMLQLARLPAQVMIIDYRGYGRSEGSPSEDGLYRDARAAWRYLTEQRSVDAKHIVIFGKSLGGAVAVDLASEVVPAGVIIESSFSSMPDMAAHHFPIVPRALIRTRMDSLDKIHDVRVPKLFVHSPADEVVPYALGRRLYEAAPEPKQFFEVAGAGHNETSYVGGEAYFDAIRSFLESVVE